MQSSRPTVWRSLPLALWLAGAVLVNSAAALDVDGLLPSGGQRGTTVEITASAKFAKWPAGAWVDRPGVTLAAAADKGKYTATIAPDAPVGPYWIRLFDDEGVSEPQTIWVGTLAEVQEVEPNNAPNKAQVVSSLPVVVNGRLGRGGDADLYSVALQKGQTLVASLDAHERLGSPVDAVMQIAAARGNVLAYNHDTHGLDPQIVFTAPADGTYLVRVFGFPAKPNQSIAFAGGDSYVYRLTLTTGPFADYVWPLALTRGRESRVELFGWNLADAMRSLTVKPDGERLDLFEPPLANLVSAAVEPHNTIAETEPNEANTPQAIELPVTITGKIEKKADVDVFSFTGKKGDSLVFQLESRAIGYPLDGVLEVTDAMSKSIVRVDDTGILRDALVAFAPPADGEYRIAVSDLNRQGSPRHVYRLRATKAEPDYELVANALSYKVAPDKPAEITVTIDRRNGFEEDIDLKVTGLPAFVTATAAQSAAKGDTAKSVKLSLTSSGGPFSGPIRITGESTGASHRSHAAVAVITDRKERTHDLWLTASGTAAAAK